MPHRLTFASAQRILAGLLTCCLSAPAQTNFESPRQVAVVRNSPLKEASGIAASRIQPGVLYTHNDGSADPIVIAIDTQGRLLATLTLQDFAEGDFEDIAVGPGPNPSLSYIYLGDIGDNGVSRSEIVIYRIPEPWVDLSWESNPVTANFGSGEALRFQYPDQAHDAETLLVDPLERELFVLTKELGISRIYKFALDAIQPAETNYLQEVGEVFFHQASGGDISSDGRQVVIRQEDFARWWNRPAGTRVEEILQNELAEFAPVMGRPTEPNGEAIGFASDGNGYYTLSDSTTTPSLYYIQRLTPPFGLPQEILVSAGSEWRYLDDGSNQGAEWRLPTFNDSNWRLGSGAFGYGDDRLQTTVRFGSSSRKKHWTTYFRRSFSVETPAALEFAELRLLMDDGCAIYLNGQLLIHPNLTAAPTHTSPALSEQKDLESVWFRFGVPIGLLRAGLNTLAVEMHQHTADSKDLHFDLQLVGRRDPRTRFAGFTAVGGQTRIRLFIPTLAPTTLEASDDLENWEAIALLEPTEAFNDFVDPNPVGKQRFYRIAP